MEITAVGNALATGGPYALVAILGWAYWRERTNNKELYTSVIKMAREMASANVELKFAMTALKDAMNTLAGRLP